MARTCRHFGISRQTFYRWFRRYDPQNLASLEERSQGMKSVTHLLDESGRVPDESNPCGSCVLRRFQ